VDRCIKRAAALQSDLRLAQSFCLSDRGSYAFGGSRSKVRLPSPARAGQAYRPRPRLSKHRQRAAGAGFGAYFFSVRIQSTRFLMSASLTWVFGGIGIEPQTPLPPLFHLVLSLANASLSPLYLAATS
jgi:hypothetical protein